MRPGSPSGWKAKYGGNSKSAYVRPAQRKIRIGLSHHQRSRERAGCAAPCAAFLGNQIRPDQTAEARRWATLLPAGGYRPAARDPGASLYRGLHHQGRPEVAARGRRKVHRPDHRNGGSTGIDSGLGSGIGQGWG